MGYGNYSQEAHEALLQGRQTLPSQQVFKQQGCHPLMNPKGVRVRESRDSAEHPRSLAVVFALDVTGSMGDIPRLLATQQLPKFMKVLTDCKVPDPQILFTAVGDATSDQSPLQVGQFESTAELMDQWLTWCHLEGGGGGTGQESYELALYFLALHTEMDCWVKRQKRGYLFMTGDEKPYPILSRHVVEAVVGDHLDDDLKVEEVVAEAQRTFTPFFIIPDRQRRAHCERTWRNLLGDHVLCMDAPADVCYVTAGALLLSEGLVHDLKELESVLLGSGMSKDRGNAVLQTLRPLAEVQGIKDGRSGFWSFWR
ncbi:MAG: VWA domain-containing protein [Thermoanaerobaculia bacterium]